MIYEYQDTIIMVRAGLGGNNFATCKRKPNGGWTTVKTKDMPRTDNMYDAVNNLHTWAKNKGLRRSDCGCCYYRGDGKCSKYKCNLEKIQLVNSNYANIRHPECDEFEKFIKSS